jgi:cytochrome c peroxidase
VFVDDPTTPAKVELGMNLYFDKRLSGSGHTNCHACHAATTRFQDNLNLSSPDRSYPEDGPALRRNTPSLLNLVYAPVFRWNGSHTDLVDVLAFPLAEPNMNVAKLPRGSEDNDVPAAKAALKAKFSQELAGYAPLFARAFGADVAASDADTLWKLTGRAFRAFLTRAVSRDAPFDRWNAGDDKAMGAEAVRGLEIFRGRGRCVECHHGPFLTDYAFHNISSAPPRADGTRADEGRYEVTHKDEDRGAFLTPSLRTAYDTSTYFHDGSKPSVQEVLHHMTSAAVTADPNHDPVFDAPLSLDATDIGDLASFLRSLRGADVSMSPPSTLP